MKPVQFSAMAAGLIASLPIPLAAQDNSGEATNGKEGGAVCLVRPLSDVPNVNASHRGQPFRVLSTEANASVLEAKGFTRVDCKVADLVLASKRDGWRDQICSLSGFGNEAVQNQLERSLGERPSVLCASAEAAVGPWQRSNQSE